MSMIPKSSSLAFSSLDPALLVLSTPPGGTSTGTSKHMKCTKKELCSWSSEELELNIVSILEKASETVEVSALFTLWLEPVEASSHTVGFLDALVLARSSFAYQANVTTNGESRFCFLRIVHSVEIPTSAYQAIYLALQCKPMGRAAMQSRLV